MKSSLIRFIGLPSQAMIFDGEMTKTDSGLILKWQLESYSPITEYKVIKYILPFSTIFVSISISFRMIIKMY